MIAEFVVPPEIHIFMQSRDQQLIRLRVVTNMYCAQRIGRLASSPRTPVLKWRSAGQIRSSTARQTIQSGLRNVSNMQDMNIILFPPPPHKNNKNSFSEMSIEDNSLRSPAPLARRHKYNR